MIASKVSKDENYDVCPLDVVDGRALQRSLEGLARHDAGLIAIIEAAYVRGEITDSQKTTLVLNYSRRGPA